MRIGRTLVSAAFAAGAALIAALSGDPAFAAGRIALVIGVSNYQNVPRLPNPASDATAIAAMFKKIGFEVDLETDVGNLPLKRALRRFADAASTADVAVVFFAGHGFEVGGINYIIPVDAKLAEERDVEDEAVSLDRVVDAVGSARELSLVLVDACRDNPFNQTMKRRTVVRSLHRGLARAETVDGSNTLIVYAAKAGSTADDGKGDHSPFTKALLDVLPQPGLDIQMAIRKVRDDVLKNTSNQQEPSFYGSLGVGDVTLVPGPAPARPGEIGLSDRADFETADRIGTAEAYEAYLNSHQAGFYSELAKAMIAKLKTAALELPSRPQSAPQPLLDDALAWDRIKDSSDSRALQDFISKYPNSPRAGVAQRRLDEAAETEWSKIKDGSDQAAVQAFLSRYPASPAAAAAKQKLAALQQFAAQEARAQAEWDKPKGTGDPATVQAFITRYPGSTLLAKAQARLSDLQQAARDEQARIAKRQQEQAAAEWETLKNTSDQAALAAFIAHHSDSPLAAIARSRLDEVRQALAEEAKAKAEWAKLKDSSDQTALQSFIARYPTSSLAQQAHGRLDTVQREAKEQEAAKLARQRQEQAAIEWSGLKSSSDQAALAAFVARYPNSPLAANARGRLDDIKQALAQQAAVEADWDHLKDTGDQAALAAFIAHYPDSPLKQQARAQLDAIERVAKDQEQVKLARQQQEQAAADWEKLKSSNDQAALTAFLAHYPTSALAADAQRRLDDIKQALAQEAKAKAAWDKLKDSTDQAAFQAFITGYPTSPLLQTAQARLEAARRAAKEQELARIARQQQEQAAADWDRLKKSADQAALGAFITRNPNSALAADAQRRIDGLKQAEADRQSAYRLAAARKAEEEQANAAEAARREAAQAAAQQAQKEAAEKKAKEEEERRAKAAAVDSQAISQQAAAGQPVVPTRPSQVATAEVPPAGVEASNTPDLIRRAQVELSRLGCFSGDTNGKWSDATVTGINRYQSRQGRTSAEIVVTEGFIAELRSQQGRVCAPACGDGETRKGDTCVVDRKPRESTKMTRHEEEEPSRRRPAHSHAAAAPAPARAHVHEEARAPSSHGGGGSGIGSTPGLGM